MSITDLDLVHFHDLPLLDHIHHVEVEIIHLEGELLHVTAHHQGLHQGMELDLWDLEYTIRPILGDGSLVH